MICGMHSGFVVSGNGTAFWQILQGPKFLLAFELYLWFVWLAAGCPTWSVEGFPTSPINVAAKTLILCCLCGFVVVFLRWWPADNFSQHYFRVCDLVVFGSLSFSAMFLFYCNRARALLSAFAPAEVPPGSGARFLVVRSEGDGPPLWPLQWLIKTNGKPTPGHRPDPGRPEQEQSTSHKSQFNFPPLQRGNG